jgi:signal transduction histidine kinase
VLIEVRNEGAPIAAELLPQLFEPFRSGRAGGAGLGLGLFIAREIVRAHGGEISVASGPSSTAFTIRLPLAR